MAETVDSASDDGQRERRLTVAHVREHAEHAEVMFFETARIYRLLRTNPAHESTLRDLRAAAAARTPVRVRFLEANGEIIESVRTD